MKDAACAGASKIGDAPHKEKETRSQASKNQLGRGAVAAAAEQRNIFIFQTRTRDAAFIQVNDTRHRAASFRFSRDSARGLLGGGRRKCELLISDRRWPITGSWGRFLRLTKGLSDNNPAMSRHAGAPATLR